MLTSGCGARLANMTDSQKAERLARERGRLQDLTDPVDKTRSWITISQILLDFAAGAGREGNMKDMQSLLDQYVTAIRSARDTIINSDRNAERDPEGYRDLEISLRGQIGQLQDLNRSLSVDDRPAVQNAIDIALSVREQVFRRLFPQTRA